MITRKVDPFQCSVPMELSGPCKLYTFPSLGVQGTAYWRRQSAGDGQERTYPSSGTTLSDMSLETGCVN